MNIEELTNYVADLLDSSYDDYLTIEDNYEESGELALIESGITPQDTFEYGYMSAVKHIYNILKNKEDKRLLN